MRNAESFMPIAQRDDSTASQRRLTDEEAQWSLMIGFGFQGV